MTPETNTIQAIARGEQDASEHHDQTARDLALWSSLSGIQREMLTQLCQRGPVWDGDVCSKQARGDLFDLGLASRAIIKGEFGYTVANYRGGSVFRAGQDAECV